MKKILATLLTLALLLGAVILPAAADEQSDLLGLWDIESLASGGMMMTKAELDANSMTMTAEFRANGTCTIIMDGEAAECTYRNPSSACGTSSSSTARKIPITGRPGSSRRTARSTTWVTT